MITIYVLRHAEATPLRDAPADHERELSAKGRKDARRLGQLLARTDQRPDQFISSTAVRARRTAELLQDGGAWSTEIPLRSTHAFYEAEPADVLGVLRTVSEGLRAVMVVGHEPAWSTVVSRLVGTAKVALRPGTCVRIDSPKGWGDVDFGVGTLRWMIPPSLLGS